jgi:hypothetical protein
MKQAIVQKFPNIKVIVKPGSSNHDEKVVPIKIKGGNNDKDLFIENYRE